MISRPTKEEVQRAACILAYSGHKFVNTAELATLRGQVRVLREALALAKGFIKNGLDLGYITPPEPGDAAYDTLPTICKALDQTKPKDGE